MEKPTLSECVDSKRWSTAAIVTVSLLSITFVILLIMLIIVATLYGKINTTLVKVDGAVDQVSKVITQVQPAICPVLDVLCSAITPTPAFCATSGCKSSSGGSPSFTDVTAPQ